MISSSSDFSSILKEFFDRFENAYDVEDSEFYSAFVLVDKRLGKLQNRRAEWMELRSCYKLMRLFNLFSMTMLLVIGAICIKQNHTKSDAKAVILALRLIKTCNNTGILFETWARLLMSSNGLKLS